MVSRRHASLEQREGRVHLCDLGSTNGTFVNGRRVRSACVELHHGDQIQIGPLCFRLTLALPKSSALCVEDAVAGWVRDNSCERSYATDDGNDDANAEVEDLEGRLRYEVTDDVLIVTPLSSHLDDESTVGPLRAGLLALYERRLPRRVVIDLSRVVHLSSSAIALFVAHHVRLERSGGMLRLCEVHARVLAVMQEIRLPMVVDIFPDRDEAILSSWTHRDAGSE
jgi:anti-anti-sigma factor